MRESAFLNYICSVESGAISFKAIDHITCHLENIGHLMLPTFKKNINQKINLLHPTVESVS